MATATAETRTIVSSATLRLTGDEAVTLMALLRSVSGSERLGTMKDVKSIRRALQDAGVPTPAPLGQIDLGD